MDVCLAPIFFVLMASETAVHSQITTGPANALRKVGDTITLDCVTRSKDCEGIEWKKMEGAQSPLTVYTRGILLNSFQDGRYSVSSTVTGGCSLTITRLQISDSGKFSCSLPVDASEETKGSILVVINVTESCRPLASITELTAGDSYSFSTAINVPPKSVEPSNVILSFQNKAVGETETTDESQPQTVRTTITGIARKEHITQRVCMASFTPTPVSNFDSITASLVVCTTQQLIVSYPVEQIAISPTSSPYYKGDRVRCVAKGHPFPTFSWTHLKSGCVIDGDTLVINGDPGDQYTCTATNTVKGRVTSQTITLEVSVPPQLKSDRVLIAIGAGVGVGLLILGGILFAVLCKRYEWIKRTKTDEKNPKGIEEDPERSRINRDDSHASQYEPLDDLLLQNSNTEPTYEELTLISTEVDVIGQSLSNRATNENKLNENESSLTEYESLQQTQLSPSDAYESMKPKKSDKNRNF